MRETMNDTIKINGTTDISINTAETECRDYKSDFFEIFVSSNGKKVWVCINGACVLRCEDIKEVIITDTREIKNEK